ncbi:MAG TPA: ATP-binding protein [Candidatus Dormibacteraeota bacterium]
MAIRPVDHDPADVLLRERLVRALESCATEAELTQTLYQFLHPVFDYQVVTLHVLERDGGYHATPVDEGVLQERVRGTLDRSVTRPLYEKAKTAVVRPDRGLSRSRGPGRGQEPSLLIWAPIAHRGEVIASVLYECTESRHVPSRELALLEEVHKELGVLVANAYLHEITRDQAARLAALNDVAKALAPTRSRDEVIDALEQALGGVIAVDSVEIVEGGGGSARIERRETGEATVKVPLWEGDRSSSSMVVRTRAADVHEESLVEFLEGVADQLSLALRSAESHAAEQAQRRRLEVVSAVGRRLAASLDRWAIMRTLREELAERIGFDIFIVATVRQGDSGPVAEGFAYDSGGEQWLPSVPLAMAGPARTAFESGQTVMIRRAPWADAVESARAPEETWVMGEGAAVFVTRPAGERQAARSVAWVPVQVAEGQGALLSIQAYQPGAFEEADVRLLEDLAPYVGLALANAKHYEDSRAESRRLEALHRVQLGLAGAADPEQVVTAVLDGMRQFLPEDRLQIELREPGGRTRGFELDDGNLVEVPTPLGGAARGSRRLRSDSATGTVWLPLQEAGRSVGVLRAERLGGGRFTGEEREFLNAVGPLVGLALARLELAEAKELMLRAIGHEIRNPAAAMNATLSSLQEWNREMDAERRELLLDEAYGMSERLLALVEAQLLIAKLELGGYEPHPEPVDVRAVVSDVVTLLSHRYDGASHIEVDAPDPLPLALCEPVHLQQVISNLIGNAFEHGRPPVRVRVQVKEGQLEIGVIDSGPGPPADVAETLFERRLRGSRSRGGLGLGLYLCRLVVERSFNGRIWVRRLPRGNAFKFTVPRA